MARQLTIEESNQAMRLLRRMELYVRYVGMSDKTAQALGMEACQLMLDVGDVDDLDTEQPGCRPSDKAVE